MLPLVLQTALKAGLAASFSWAMCQFFGFTDAAFLTVMMAISTIMMGLGLGWVLAIQGFLSLTLVVAGTIIILVLFGKNYLSFFISVLFVGLLWDYLKNHGVVGNFFLMMAMISVTIINSNNPDPVTYGFNMLVNMSIGIGVGMIFNRLFWPTTSQQGLQQQLEQMLRNSSQLTRIMFRGYLQDNFNSSEGQQLRIEILKGVQSSQKLLKIGTLDPTGKQLGEADWMSIINAEQQISLHLSAILRLIQDSQGINLSKELESDWKRLSESIATEFSQMADAMITKASFRDLSQLNNDFFQFKEKLTKLRTTDIIKNMPLSERLHFYSIVYRLEKLINEMNKWGISQKSEVINISQEQMTNDK